MYKYLKKAYNILNNVQRQNNELMWTQIWDDTKKGIVWMNDISGISPGRWAVGYNYLYVMTRILNEFNPHSVLDLGLGISSTLISQYFKYQKFSDSEHIILEQDEKWASFYLNSNHMSSASQLFVQKCIVKEIDGVEYFAYENIGKVIKNKKFAIISIDGPKGSEKYSRRDILDYLPEILEKSFVIVIDDAQRDGERRTISEIESILEKNNITYENGWYSGMTDCCVITSKDNKYFCSM